MSRAKNETAFCGLLLALCVLIFPGHAGAEEKLVPRTVIALYDGTQMRDPAASLLHRLAEMPLNHLGLTLEYHDVNGKLPDVKNRADVRGVITWFLPGTFMEHPAAYLAWAGDVIGAGRKYVILGNPGFYESAQGKNLPAVIVNRFLGRLGLHREERWVGFTPGVTYTYNTPSMFAASDPFHWLKPPYDKMTVADKTIVPHLVAHEPGQGDSVLIATSPTGGYAAENYLYRSEVGPDDDVQQWHIDPFVFFRLAFDTDDLPKPDTTTLDGRRMYYSHIDGDGWNNYVRLEEYKNKPTIAAQVIYDKIIKPHPDLPVTVTAIGADLNPDWAAVAQSREVATALFALPQVEAGTHTYTHPFDWGFFEDGKWEKEKPYLNRYRYGGWARKPALGFLPAVFSSPHGQEAGEGDGSGDYSVPRAYANEHFDIHKEIEGSVKEIASLLPPGKKVEVITWSGDCQPFEEAVRLAREAGLKNINGGDSRFDAEYPSYATVAPIGRQVGKEWQVYASGSNENTYTHLWTGRFHGFQYLRNTLEHTETPIRVAPLNIYYHFYSAERQASLNALSKNIDYALRQPIIPVTTGHFSGIAQGFYTVQLIKAGESAWRVRGRGELQTIRFDHATLRTVDFPRSSGVTGQRHYQGSLYVSLDESAKEPVIALKPANDYGEEASASVPYLIESRWHVTQVRNTGGGFSFTAQGFGIGEMTWQVPWDGSWLLRMQGGSTKSFVARGRRLRLNINESAIAPRNFTLTRSRLATIEEPEEPKESNSVRKPENPGELDEPKESQVPKQSGILKKPEEDPDELDEPDEPKKSQEPKQSKPVKKPEDPDELDEPDEPKESQEPKRSKPVEKPEDSDELDESDEPDEADEPKGRGRMHEVSKTGARADP